MEYQPSYSDSLRADILPSYSDSLMHYGVLGMKWGVRRYQNKDGTYTAQGKKHRNASGISARHLKTAAALATGAAVVGGIAYLRHKSNDPDVMLSEYDKVCTKEAKSKIATYTDLYDSCDDAVRKGWASVDEKMCRQNARVMRNEISEFEKIVSDSDEYIKARLTNTSGNERRLLTLKQTTRRLRRHIDTMNGLADDMEGLADVIHAHDLGDPRSLDELVDDMIAQHDEAAKQSKSSKPRTEQSKPFKPFGALPAKGQTSKDESVQSRLEDLKYDRDEAIDEYNAYLNGVVESNRNKKANYDTRKRRMDTLERTRQEARQRVKEYEDYKNSLGHYDIYGNYLMHYGVKGQKWGVRRYQNRDGSYTARGKKHNKRGFKLSENQKKALMGGAALAVGTAAGAYAIGKSARAAKGLKRAYDNKKLQPYRDRILRDNAEDLEDFRPRERNRIVTDIAKKQYKAKKKAHRQLMIEDARRAGYKTGHKILSKIAPTKKSREAHEFDYRYTEPRPIEFKPGGQVPYDKGSVSLYLNDLKNRRSKS